MIDIHEAVKLIESTLYDVTRHTGQLAVALQNVAPFNKEGQQNHSILYLIDVTQQLQARIPNVNQVLQESADLQQQQILSVMREILELDQFLRDTHQMGNKYRFVREQLQQMLSSFEATAAEVKKVEEKQKVEILEDEMPVYVYLFNAQGVDKPTWQKLLKSTQLYDYGVNRPIYIEQGHIEGFIRRKENRQQHGYLTIIIKKDAVIKTEETASLKDVYDSPLIKVKDGVFHFNKLLSFTHDDKVYAVSEDGSLVLKKSSDGV